jgi:Protein of unknown function (DUF2878)
MSDAPRISTPVRSAAEKWAPSLYFVVGQAGWFACVISAARGVPWWGVALALVLVTIHVVRVARPLQELKLILSVLVIGGIWESALVYFGLLSYPSGTVVRGLAPIWILALWALFAAQFNTTYTWLKPRLALAALLGAIAGPLSFRAGAQLGALRFAKPWPATVALAIGWSVLLLLVIVLSRRWDGVRE